MGLQNYIVSALLVGLCIFGFMFWAYQTGEDNQMRNIMNETPMKNSMGNLSKKLNDSKLTSEAQLNATTNEPATVGYGSLILFSILTAGRVFTGMVTGIYDTIMVLSFQTLGLNPVIIGVFTSIILIILIFYAWRMYRSGY